MKTRKFLNFLGGVLAAGAISSSVFLPFLSRGDLLRQNFTGLILPYFDIFSVLEFFQFPAAYVIFAIATFFALFAIFQKKFLAFCGVVFAFAWLAFLEMIGQLNLFGYGTLLFAGGAILGMVILLLPKARKSKDLK